VNARPPVLLQLQENNGVAAVVRADSAAGTRNAASIPIE
jgi:hypothetical protein